MTDRSLYDDLGVPKDATPEEIRQAYRKKAAALHPDNQETGDEEAFKRVSRANLILSDAEKREQYDRTGREDTSNPEERELATAMGLLAQTFSQVFTMAEFDPTQHDPLKAVRKIVKMQRKEISEKLFALATTIEKMQKTIKRLRKKGKKQKASKLQLVLSNLEKDLRAEEETGKSTIRVCDRVFQILDEHEYDLKPEANTPTEDILAGFLGSDAVKRMKARFEKEAGRG